MTVRLKVMVTRRVRGSVKLRMITGLQSETYGDFIRGDKLMSYLIERRRRLAALVPHCVLLVNGWERPRNYPGNTYAFRGDSQVIFLGGVLPAGAVLLLVQGQAEIFLEPVSLDDAVWSGPGESWESMSERFSATLRPLSELAQRVEKLGRDNIASLPIQDPRGERFLEELLGRKPDFSQPGKDRELALALIELRLCADEQAQRELREACRITVEAHLAGMAATRVGSDERDVLAAMMCVLHRQGATTSFAPIISMAGERLHQPHVGNRLREGAMLLVDFGAENEQGWAGDVTNTWPVSGKYSPEQRALYQVVLAAHRRCAAMLKPGCRYREVHMESCRALAEGLVELGILRGQVEDLVERDVHAVFYPHGIGHLMGLDVHDMEDLGDLAGYQEGRVRSTRFGLNCLRLDRDLRPGMVMTIEPGLYFIPELLDDSALRAKYAQDIDWDKVETYRRVRGIRIERDYIVTEAGHDILTPGLPDEPEDVERLIGVK